VPRRDLSWADDHGVDFCNDANHPQAAARLAAAGAQLLCYPLNNMLDPRTADRWRERSVANLQARALETGCWIVAADVTGRRGEQISYGCTAVCSPDGAVVARAPELAEGVAVYDLG
jgi:predicted amidohydrolase